MESMDIQHGIERFQKSRLLLGLIASFGYVAIKNEDRFLGKLNQSKIELEHQQGNCHHAAAAK